MTDVYVVPGIGFICKLETDTVRNYDNQVAGSLTSSQGDDDLSDPDLVRARVALVFARRHGMSYDRTGRT